MLLLSFQSIPTGNRLHSQSFHTGAFTQMGMGGRILLDLGGGLLGTLSSLSSQACRWKCKLTYRAQT